jgi:hypothetical protein
LWLVATLAVGSACGGAEPTSLPPSTTSSTTQPPVQQVAIRTDICRVAGTDSAAERLVSYPTVLTEAYTLARAQCHVAPAAPADTTYDVFVTVFPGAMSDLGDEVRLLQTGKDASGGPEWEPPTARPLDNEVVLEARDGTQTGVLVAVYGYVVMSFVRGGGDDDAQRHFIAQSFAAAAEEALSTTN